MPKQIKYKLKNNELDGKKIGKKIAEIRKAKGITQIELSEKIGITQQLISDYETGRLNISAELLLHFAVALEVSSDHLLGLLDGQIQDNKLSLRFTRRMREIDKLPEIKKKAILKTLDDLIRANL